MNILKLLFCLLLLVPNPTTNTVAFQEKIQGKVIGIKDGDTIELLYKGRPLIIRLAHVDCPELRKGQPFGRAAKKFTSSLCVGQTVTVLNDGKFDRYKRLIAVIINQKGQNVNKELVKAGMAWHFKKYSTDEEYARLENVARAAKIGLWSDKFPVAPWEWRKP